VRLAVERTNAVHGMVQLNDVLFDAVQGVAMHGVVHQGHEQVLVGQTDVHNEDLALDFNVCEFAVFDDLDVVVSARTEDPGVDVVVALGANLLHHTGEFKRVDDLELRALQHLDQLVFSARHDLIGTYVDVSQLLDRGHEREVVADLQRGDVHVEQSLQSVVQIRQMFEGLTGNDNAAFLALLDTISELL